MIVVNKYMLFDEDIEKINNAVANYPIGSQQIGEIAKLSGLLYNEGVDVLKLLVGWCIKHDIDLREHGWK